MSNCYRLIRRIPENGYKLYHLSMTKKESISCFKGIYNLLDNQERSELLSYLLPLLDRCTKEKILQYCMEKYPSNTILVLEENGVIDSIEE